MTEVKKVIIWGNHSATQYPDLHHATVDGKPALSLVDQSWFKDSFIPTVQQRGAAVIKARGTSSAASAAAAAIDHMHDWMLGTRRRRLGQHGAFPSDGSYGIPEGVIYSYPVTCKNGEYSIVQGLDHQRFQPRKNAGDASRAAGRARRRQRFDLNKGRSACMTCCLSAGIAVGWLVLFVGAICILAYRRASLAASTGVLLAAARARTGRSARAPTWWKIAVSVPFALLLLLNLRPLRIRLLTRPVHEEVSQAAARHVVDGTRGARCRHGVVGRRIVHRRPELAKAHVGEGAGAHAGRAGISRRPMRRRCAPCSTTGTSRIAAPTCRREVWDFIKAQGFFAMIIPRRYGGLEFSAYAHSCVLIKIASRSATASSTIAVPNSLGPAELLLHYGTEAQKNHYLPRLARGDEVPCFALTGPRAGSDAASIPDTGIICKGQWQGAEIIGIKLNFSKRYITLAPVATVIGLAFRLYDPEHLMGETSRSRASPAR